MSDKSQTVDSAEPEPGLFPVHPKWYKVGFYVFLLLWLGYILVETMSYTRREDWLFPTLLSVPVAILLLIQLFKIQKPELVRRVMPERKSADTEDDDLQRRFEEATKSIGVGRSKREREKYELIMIGWVLILPFMMFYVGMGLTLVVYVFTFTWYFVRSLRTATIVTIAVVGFVYVLFIEILDMILWTGQLGLPDPLEYLDDLF